jgi:ABC-2 type transport system permease protein
VSALLRSELLKQRSTRTNLGLLGAMLGLAVLVALLHGLAFSADQLAIRSNQMKVFGWGTTLGALFAALLGAMSITAEIRHGTIRPTFLITPRRERVIAAKIAVSMAAGLVLGLAAEAVVAGLGSAALSVRGISIQLNAGDFALMICAGAGASALWAAIGVGVGTLARNQVATMVGICAWVLLIENALLGDAPGVGKFAPAMAAAGLSGTTLGGVDPGDLLAPAAAALVLVAYAATAVALGRVAVVRRDVT